jgi:hypothetical protein
MKHTLHFFLITIVLLSGINSFAENKSNDTYACPTANISYVGTPFCSSDTNIQAVTLTGTDAYLGGFFTSMPSGLDLNPTTGTITPNTSTPGIYTISYTIPSGPGCPSIAVTTTIEIVEQVNTGTDGTLHVCENNTTPIDLFSIITGEQAGGVWIRTSGSGGTFNAAAGTFTLTPGTTITSTFEYILSTSAPCSDDSSIATVIIGSAPTGITISGGTTTCVGIPVNLTVTGTPGTVITMTDGISQNTYTIGASGVINIPVTPTVTTTYTLTSASLNTCSIPLNQNITITINPIPGTPIGLPNNEICSGEITNLTISSFPNIAGTMLEWTVTDSQNVTGFTANGIGLSPIIFINDVLMNTSNVQGFVKYSVTSKLGNCFGNTTDYIVFVNPLPISSLADGAIYEDNNSNIIPYILNTGLDNTNYSFNWFLLNTTTNTYELIAGANASTYEAIVVGNYQVIVTNLNTNCYTQDEAEVVLLLNSNNFEKNADLKIFPNPVTDILNIENEFQINSIKVYNQLGQMVFGKEINNNNTQLELSNINSGIYNVLIETEKGTFNHKIVKK